MDEFQSTANVFGHVAMIIGYADLLEQSAPVPAHRRTRHLHRVTAVGTRHPQNAVRLRKAADSVPSSR